MDEELCENTNMSINKMWLRILIEDNKTRKSAYYMLLAVLKSIKEEQEKENIEKIKKIIINMNALTGMIEGNKKEIEKLKEKIQIEEEKEKIGDTKNGN